MHLSAGLVEKFARETESPETPVDEAEDVEERGVMVMEIDRYHRHFQLFDEPDYGGLPLTVADVERTVDFRDGPGGEEPDGVTFADVSHSLADAVHRDPFLFRVVAFRRVDGDKRRAHGRDIIEKHIDHHAEVGPVAAYNLNKHESVQGSERVIGDGDERGGREHVEHILVVDTFPDMISLVDQEVGEFNPGFVAITGMNLIALVDYEPVHQGFHDFGMAVEDRGNLSDIIVIQQVRTNSRSRRMLFCVLNHSCKNSKKIGKRQSGMSRGERLKGSRIDG